jgi:thiosulfate/3-mercaptopyruvate sulfurtransferase
MFCIRASITRRMSTDIRIVTKRKPLMETKELNEILKSEDNLKHLKVLDCSWFLPTDPRKALDLYKIERIPYSQLFHIDEVADKSSHMAHMLPRDEEFIRHMKLMDIRKNDYIVCYDRAGMFSAPRAWYTFKLFGCTNVFVLNGGYPKWTQENLPIEKGENYGFKELKRDEPSDSDYTYKLDRSKVINMDQIIETSAKIVKGKSDLQIIDCRPPLRFKGEVEEPRPTKRRGHIDGAVNVFFKDLLDDNNCFKSNGQLIDEFNKRNVDLNKNIIFSCGSGCTACIDIFAMTLIDKFDNCKLYDGSWAEYVKYYSKIY